MRNTYTTFLLFSLNFVSGCSSTIESISTEIYPWSVSLSVHNKDHDLKEIRLTNTSESDLKFLIVTWTFPGALVVAKEGELPQYYYTSQYYEIMVRGIPRPEVVHLAPSEYIAYDLLLSDLVPAFYKDSEFSEDDLVRVDLMRPVNPSIGITSKWFLAAELLDSEPDDADNRVNSSENPKNYTDD